MKRTHFQPIPQEQAFTIVAQYGIPMPYLLFVGSLQARKNLVRLLCAYAKVRQCILTPPLVIVGARRWRSDPIARTVAALTLEPFLVFTGFVPDEALPALYSAATLFLFPSLYEGFGFPVLEAMACGTPVVTSNLTSLPEVAGDAALLVNPYDVNDIADAIQTALTMPEVMATLRHRGLAQATRFSWDQTARETISLYQRIVAPCPTLKRLEQA
jgi:glycosyltransferase involved in cell wall biosynthesis